MERKKPEVGKAILFSIAGLIAFYICYFVLAFLLALLFGILLNIPIIKNIISFLFRFRGDSPDIFIVLASATFAYAAASWMIGRFCDTTETHNLTCRILGIILIVINILFLIVNIQEGNPLFPNVVVGIAGLIMFFKARE